MTSDVLIGICASSPTHMRLPGEHPASASESETPDILSLSICFWRDVIAGQSLIARQDGRSQPSAHSQWGGLDFAQARAVVRGEVVRGEAVPEEFGPPPHVWRLLGGVVACSPRDLQSWACRVQARMFVRSHSTHPPAGLAQIAVAGERGDRRSWTTGVLSEVSSHDSRSPHALRLLLERELAAASVELSLELPLDHPWPTSTLEPLNGLSEFDARQVVASLRGRTPTAAVVRRAMRRFVPDPAPTR